MCGRSALERYDHAALVATAVIAAALTALMVLCANHFSGPPSAAQRKEYIDLIVGERLVGGGDRRFGGCEA